MDEGVERLLVIRRVELAGEGSDLDPVLVRKKPFGPAVLTERHDKPTSGGVGNARRVGRSTLFDCDNLAHLSTAEPLLERDTVRFEELDFQSCSPFIPQYERPQVVPAGIGFSHDGHRLSPFAPRSISLESCARVL